MKLKIEYVNKEELKPYANNAKLHPAEQVEQIKKSIEQFGMNDPIAVWHDNEVIEGHGRLLAVMEMEDVKKVPIIRLDDLTDEQRRAYGLIHNKLTMNSDFDEDLLDIELGEIVDIDMSDFGFELPQYIAGDPDAPNTETGFNYKEQYGVIVMCKDEREQEQIYNRLTDEGFDCKVVAT